MSNEPNTNFTEFLLGIVILLMLFLFVILNTNINRNISNKSKVYYEYNIYHECVIDPQSKAILMCKCDTIPCDTIYIPIK